MQALDRLLLHPHVQRLGGIQALASAVIFGLGIVKGIDPLIAVGVVLFAINLALLATQKLRRSQRHERPAGGPAASAPPQPTSPPAGGRVYGNAAIRQAISEAAEDQDRESIMAEFVTMIEEGKKLCESEFTGELTWSDFYPWWEGIMAFVIAVFGDAERQRLIEIEPTGAEPKDRINAVMDWLREHRDHPERWTPKLSGDDLAAAIRKRRAAIADPLGDQIDSLMQKGIKLVAKLSTPVEPEETEKGVWKTSGGDAPQEWIDLAAAYQQHCRTLLETQRPALLADFRDGHMKHFRMEREANERREQNSAADRRSDGEKMLDLANYERSGPRREVEACLEGLAAARKAI